MVESPSATLHYYRRATFPGAQQSVFTALGRAEVDLTLGLAAVLAAHPEIVPTLLRQKDLARLLRVLPASRLRRLVSVALDAEELQPDKRRRDLVLRLYDDLGHGVTIIIEAKATGLSLGPQPVSRLREQLDGYLEASSAADAVGDFKVGVALTRVPNLGGDDRVASMTWTDIIEVLGHHPNLLLARQFREHLLVSAQLRDFDTEVLSSPAGDTISSIQEFRIHAHPAERAQRVALYLAPRTGRGGHVQA